MKPRLDLHRSIDRQRLSYKITAKSILLRVFDNSLWIIWIAIPALLIIANEKHKANMLLSFIPGIIVVFMLISLYYINKLIKISGSNLIVNRTRIIELVHEKFPDVVIDESGENVINCRQNIGLFTWGKQITIIMNRNELLINYTTLGRNGIKSPFHSLFNYLKLKQLRREF